MPVHKIPPPPDDKAMAAGERAMGGRWKRRVFARLVWQGMDPYAAFLRADYPVRGVNAKQGYDEDGARRRAAQMAESEWCREWVVAWSIDPKEQVKCAVPDAIAVLVDGLSDRRDGIPTALAVRCAENLLDRGGVVRSQKLETEEASDPGTRDAKALIRMIRQKLEELEGPVRRPPAIEAMREPK